MPIQFKCPHCGVMTNVEDQFAGSSGPCRQCGQMVSIPHSSNVSAGGAQAAGNYSVPCPRCDSRLSHPGPWPWYLGTIGAIFVSARVCGHCGFQFDARKPQADFARRKMRLALLINGFGALGILTVIGLLGLLIYVTMN